MIKRLALLFFLLASTAYGQGVRFSSTVTQQGTIGTATNAVVLPAGATIAFCNHPANAVPCTNKATTYQDQTLAVACSTSTQLVLDGTSTCVALPDAQDNWGVWVAPNSSGYDYTITLPGGVNRGPFNVLSQTANVITSQLNNVVTVDGAINTVNPKYPATDVGIQAAINAAEAIGSGSTVYLPTGTYSLCNNLPLLISSRVNIKGEGWSSFLQVCAGLSASTDVILVQPAVGQTVNGIRLQDFQILPVSGHPGRHAIQMDGTNGPIVEPIIEHIIVFSGLGSSAINAVNSFGAFGTPTQAVIQNCELSGGITMSSAGDTIRIVNNLIQGSGPAIDISMIQGSSDILVQGNNITSDGGVHIGGASTNNTFFQFMNNEIETLGTFTGSNGSLVDVDCSAGFHCVDAVISKNTFQVVNGITANGIRVNFADRTNIFGNRFGRGATTSKDILVTANATDTQIGTNTWVAGGPSSAMVSDSGTRTVFASGFNGGFLHNNKVCLSWFDDAGTQRCSVQMDQFGANNIFGYHGQNGASFTNGASYIYDGSAGSNIALAAANTQSAVPVTGTIVSMASLSTRGITNSTGLQLFNTTTTCTTAATISTPCTTAAITLPVGYADTNYRLSISCLGVTQFPQVQTYTKSNTTFTITLNNLTAAAATCSSFDVIAGHN